MTGIADTVISLGQNMALVLALLFACQRLETLARHLGLRWEQTVFGFLFGLAACGGMLIPVGLAPGVMMDSRGVLVGLAALFGGGAAGIAAAVPVCLFRLYLGGAGMWAGAGATLCAMLAGVFFAQWLRRAQKEISGGHLLALGGLVAAIFIGSTLFIPTEQWLEGLLYYGVPFVAAYSAGTLALGLLIKTEIARRIAAEERERSEALFRQATLATRIGVWDLDPTSGKLVCSENVEEILGIEAGTLGDTLDQFLKTIVPDDIPRVEATVRDALAGADIVDVEYRTRWRDGSVHWYAAKGTVERDGTGQACRILGVLTDISEGKLARQALEESEARLAESQQIASIGSWIWRDGEGFAWCSDAMYALLDARRGELDTDFDAFVRRAHPADRAKLLECGQRLVGQLETVQVEWRLLRPDGGVRHMFAIARPNVGLDGSVIDYRGICQDITTRKLAELGVREREDRYRRLVEGLPICIHEIDTEGKIAAINRAGVRMINAPGPAVVCGRDYLDLMAPCDRDRVQSLFARALAGEPSQFEITPPVDGCTRIFNSSFIPLVNDEGNVYRIMGHTIDLTQERAREADLHRLGTAIEQAVESIVITDPNAVIEYVNPAYEKITGYTRAESIGQRMSLVKSGTHDEEFYTSVWKTISSGQTWQGEFLNKRKNGEHFHQRSTISPIFGTNGEIVNYVSVQHDITHEIELEKQLNRAQKMEALGTLAGGIAHDFNNILHSMLGFCHIARDAGLNDPAALDQSLREIELGANRAAALVEQILTFSRTSDVRFMTISLVAEVEDALRFLRGSLPPSIEIQFHAESGAGNVFGDPTQIHQLVTNLCTNAYHAMEDRGGLLEVNVCGANLDAPRQTLSGLLAPGDYTLLRVEDHGVGIDPASFDKLFDPFYTTKNVGKGTGLGLSMVHGIATRMGGAIDIESELARGTVVSVFLPVSRESAIINERRPTAALAEARGSGTILLVDDDESITNMVSIVLRRHGYEVITYNSPALALEELEGSSVRFDLVICDLTMPRMNGIELSRRIRALHPDVPILLATGVIDDEKLDSVHESGICDILRKPFHINELIEAIGRNLPSAVATQHI